jgi:transcription antitermination factor NusG
MEKRSVSHLQSSGLEADAAVAEVNHRWSDRVKRVGKPLFPGYIFARFNLTGLALPLSYPGIVGIVRVEGIPAPIRDDEIAAVRLLATGVTSTGSLPKEVDFEEMIGGSPVMVISGPFTGLTGVLLQARGKGCVAVHIEAIRQVRTVQLERSAICFIPEIRGEGEVVPTEQIPG